MHPSHVANPIAPYQWVAVYTGGGQLRQFESETRHHSGEIDPARLVTVFLEGPAGPIMIPVHRDVGPPSAVDIRARVLRRLGDPAWEERRIQVAYRYGLVEDVTTVDLRGSLRRVWTSLKGL